MQVEAFIARWSDREGGAERANTMMFLSELCDVIGVARPEPAGADTRFNDYVFERAVRPRASEGAPQPRRIDLYKRDCFILEAKQSRLPGREKALPEREAPPRRAGRATRNWDVMMQNARRQAEGYVFLLDPSHAAPPFLLVVDVGRVIELYADFTGTGRGYGQFPDRNGFRITLDMLREESVRRRLALVWTDPNALDPAREAARVTRGVAERLAVASRHLEAEHPPAEVAQFLVRCIFTMFAEDVGLLPKDSFSRLLADCVETPEAFAPTVTELWRKMDAPRREDRFFTGFRAHLRHFNGNLFREASAFALPAAEIAELLAAARVRWTEVDPAIFGTLLEQALEPAERRRLGAHYTPRAYVERLVAVTVMEPLRADWQAALTRAQAAGDEGDMKRAAALVRAFHDRLCATRVLDPACGTGNFLYVALEMMKKLEGEVLEALVELGETAQLGLEGASVDPHQFLGLELNPRAASIAELVVWIGYLQQHYRTRSGHPAEPILRAFRTINDGGAAGLDAVLAHDGPDETGALRNPRRPVWPQAEFIVGNPPFKGGKELRGAFGASYAQALWAAHPWMNESANLYMYWWDRAAEILTRPDTVLRRFGLVTSATIGQVLQRRTIERHLRGGVSIVYAIPNHPWTKASRQPAAVRIAMTVAQAGHSEGTLARVTSESDLDTDEPRIAFEISVGQMHADLSIGANLVDASPLRSNASLCSPGIKLHGAGFIVDSPQARKLGLGIHAGLEDHVPEYRHGKDLTGRSRGKRVIDLFGLTQDEVRRRFPEIYQHVSDSVRYDLDPSGEPKRNKDGKRTGREWNARPAYRDNWWIFGEPRSELREALCGLPRYIATVETSKHRTFQFLDAAIRPDNMLVAIASADAAHLGVLSSRVHVDWAVRQGGRQGVGNDPRYSKSRCFDPFPFPPLEGRTVETLRATAEELDETRRRVLADNPDLTLTGLYNVLDAMRQGAGLSAKQADIRRRGLVLILQELHEAIDRATLQAYGWPAELGQEAVLERLVALNAARAREEAAGLVRWLRPDYQRPLLERGAGFREEAPAMVPPPPAALPPRPVFPADVIDQPLAVERLLAGSGRAMTPAEIAEAFAPGRRVGPRAARALQTLLRFGRIVDLGDGRMLAARGGSGAARAAP